jgi:type II secretory pathway pseudopilin PulG
MMNDERAAMNERISAAVSAPAVHRSSFIIHRCAFTLTEILIVIGIIVLMLGLAVPAFHLITGTRSLEGAENQVNAMLGRARADALGLQKPHGIMFFMRDDPLNLGNALHNGTVYVAEVQAADYPEPPGAAPPALRGVYLDIVPNTEFLALPAGVLAQVLNSDAPGTVDDRYLGYSSWMCNGGTNVQVAPDASGDIALWGGVILFGGDGQIISQTYGFRTAVGDPAAPVQTAMGKLIGQMGTNGFLDCGPTGKGAGAWPTSSLGFVLFEREAFKSGSGFDDGDFQTSPTNMSTSDSMPNSPEEQWIDDNSIPLLVNRYNGTLIRGE